MGKQHARKRGGPRKRAHIPGYTNEFETAEELGISIRLLRKWRQLRLGPPYIEVGRQFHYSDESRAAWLKGREVQPVHEQVAAA